MYRKRNNELEIMSLYRLNYKARFYLREISKLSNLPLKTCHATLRNLETAKLLKSKTEGKNKYFSLNMENIKSKYYLHQAELYQTLQFIEKYPPIQTFLKSLKTTAVVVVFGSFARFKAGKNSDLDLLLITDKEIEPPYHLLPYKPHPITLTKKSFLKATGLQEDLIKEIEENHIIINNHSFYVNAMWNHYEKR